MAPPRRSRVRVSCFGDDGAYLGPVVQNDFVLDPPAASVNKKKKSRPRRSPSPPAPSEYKVQYYRGADGMLHEIDLEALCPACGEKVDPHDNPNCIYGDVSPPPLYVPSGATIVKRPPRVLNTKENAIDNTIAFRNLPENYSDADLCQVCSAFGPLVDVEAIIDDETGLCLGNGYVRFENIDDAEKAIEGLNIKYGYDAMWLV